MPSETAPEAVHAALARDPMIDLPEWPLVCESEGDSLRLSGVVADIAAKRRAMATARAAVADPVIDAVQLQVTRQRGDAELREALAQRLLQEPIFRDTPILEAGEPQPGSEAIRVGAEHGVARLDGALRSLTHRRIAEVLAWWTPGVGDVDNRIHVEPAEADSDAELADAAAMVLEMDPALHAEPVQARVHDRVIHLSGQVSSDATRQVAIWDCWYLPGVHDVMDTLQVSG